MSTVHFIYPRDLSRNDTPFAIGNELGRRLQADYPVRFHDWRSTERLDIGPGDVLIGHPHRRRHTAFQQGLATPALRRRLVLAPYVPDLRQVAWLDPIVSRCDLFLAITGRYWFERIAESSLRRWAPKMRHVDLAVDRARFAPLPRQFNPPGRRRFVYIGHTAHNKNVGYLAALQSACPETRFGWIGRAGRRGIAGVEAFGILDFAQTASRAILSKFDFLLTVGRCDANPTTILEAIAWGLVPVCTPQSGYDGQAGIVNLPLDDLPAAVARLRMLQECPTQELLTLQAEGRAALDSHFHWDRVYAQVRDAIESTESPLLQPPDWRHRWRLLPGRLIR